MPKRSDHTSRTIETESQYHRNSRANRFGPSGCPWRSELAGERNNQRGDLSSLALRLLATGYAGAALDDRRGDGRDRSDGSVSHPITSIGVKTHVRRGDTPSCVRSVVGPLPGGVLFSPVARRDCHGGGDCLGCRVYSTPYFRSRWRSVARCIPSIWAAAARFPWQRSRTTRRRGGSTSVRNRS